jgi:hypothetical protein
LALAGGARSVHRWFEGSFTDVASTIMHRSTRLRLALERFPTGSSVRRHSTPRSDSPSGRRRVGGSSVRTDERAAREASERSQPPPNDT